MRVTSAVAITPLVSAAAAWTPASTTGTDILAAEGLVKLAVYQHNNPSPSGCTLENAYVRREWDSLSTEQKEQYVQAVLCLQSKPSISGDLVPGARSRFDDFVGTHINQTLTIHGTVRDPDPIRSHAGTHLTQRPGQLPHMAPVFYVDVRASSSQ